MTDPIADMLTQIRNAAMANKPEVVIGFSKQKLEIANLLSKEGYLKEVVNEKEGDMTPFGQIRIVLKYNDVGEPVIKNMKRISKPGLRVYISKNEIPRILHGLGTAIISTPSGILTDKQARKAGIGGEHVLSIW
jgi:small subunit ribosomal protein S8